MNSGIGAPSICWAIDNTTSTFAASGAPVPTYWAVWGHKGAGSWGGCIRSFTVDPSTGAITFSGTPAGAGFTIDNMDREGLNDGQGALIVQANDGMATVVYSNQDNVPATTADCSSNTSIGWGSVSTTDGDDWTSHSQIFHSTNFAWCTLTWIRSGANPKVIKGTREFDFVIAPDGNSYVAVNDSADSIRLFMSVTRGVPVPGLGAPNDNSLARIQSQQSRRVDAARYVLVGTGFFPHTTPTPRVF